MFFFSRVRAKAIAVSGRVKSNAVVPPTVSIERVSNSTVPALASVILSGGRGH